MQIFYKAAATSVFRLTSSIGEKGTSVQCYNITTDASNNNKGGKRQRNAAISEDGATVKFENATEQYFGSSETTKNQYFVPDKIVGFKYQ